MGLSPRIPQLAIALTVVASVVGYLLLVQNSQMIGSTCQHWWLNIRACRP